MLIDDINSLDKNFHCPDSETFGGAIDFICYTSDTEKSQMEAKWYYLTLLKEWGLKSFSDQEYLARLEAEYKKLNIEILDIRSKMGKARLLLG